MIKTYKLYIDGKWISSSSKKKFSTINPATEQVIGYFQQGDEKDVNLAVRAAKSKLKSWSETPAPVRGEILFNIRDILKKRKKELGKLVSMEMGKIISEAEGDVQEAIDVFEYMAAEGRRLFGHTTPSELKDKFCMTIRRPIGVCGLITPWNFPIAIPAWKLAPALICGNTVVFKPSSDTPLCATRLIEILEESGIPKGVVNLVTGPGSAVGKSLISHKDVLGISFTGNRDTGDFILKNAGIKRVGLELGGKNPIIVMDDADLDLATDGIIWGAFGTTGQRCTAASRVIVHKSIKKQLEENLLKRIRRLKIGPGYKRDTDIGPLINKEALEKSKRYTEIGKKEKAKLLCGGEKYGERGYYFKPTVFTDVKSDMRIAQEEIFGPIVALIPIKDLNEAINVANSVSYGLSSSIYTKDMANAFRTIEKLEAGITYINSSTIGSEVHLPFGGIKQTGNGTREAGIFGIDEFSEVKTVYIDYSGRLQKAQGIDK